jgi:hypothetical protein
LSPRRALQFASREVADVVSPKVDAQLEIVIPACDGQVADNLPLFDVRSTRAICLDGAYGVAPTPWRLHELPDIATKISAELRNQYILGYHPSNRARGARWRKNQNQTANSQGSSATQCLRKNRLLCAQSLD